MRAARSNEQIHEMLDKAKYAAYDDFFHLNDKAKEQGITHLAYTRIDGRWSAAMQFVFMHAKKTDFEKLMLDYPFEERVTALTDLDVVQKKVSEVQEKENMGEYVDIRSSAARGQDLGDRVTIEWAR